MVIQNFGFWVKFRLAIFTKEQWIQGFHEALQKVLGEGEEKGALKPLASWIQGVVVEKAFEG